MANALIYSVPDIWDLCLCIWLPVANLACLDLLLKSTCTDLGLHLDYSPACSLPDHVTDSGLNPDYAIAYIIAFYCQLLTQHAWLHHTSESLCYSHLQPAVFGWHSCFTPVWDHSLRDNLQAGHSSFDCHLLLQNTACHLCVQSPVHLCERSYSVLSGLDMPSTCTSCW